jgi:hypothetical protein
MKHTKTGKMGEVAKNAAKKELSKHVETMHAKGGKVMHSRGGGAARPSSLVFRRNG